MAFPTMPAGLRAKITRSASKDMEEVILQASLGDGYGQVAEDGLNAKREVWTIEFAPLDETLLTAFRDFYNTVGVTKPFWWTPPKYSSPQKGIFVAKTFKESFVSGSKKRVQITIKQSFEIEI
jgi:phage-related protein